MEKREGNGREEGREMRRKENRNGRGREKGRREGKVKSE